MKRLLVCALGPLPLVALLCCSNGNSSGPSTTCATTADCPPATVCATPTGQCIAVPNNEFIGTFRCYVLNYPEKPTSDELGASEVEGLYKGTQFNFLLSAGCSTTKLTDGTQILLVEIEALPTAPDGVAGLSFALSWSEAQGAPVDIDLVPDAEALNDGVLIATPEGGAAAAVAVSSSTGVVHLDQAPAVGSWLTGYIDAPLQVSQ